MTPDLINACHTEVIEFHRALEAWLRGEPPRVASEIARMELALAIECVLITPNGTIDSKATLQDRLFQAHGSAPDMQIRISDFAPVWTAAEVALVRYVEWRESRGQTTGRYSSVLFRAERDAPAGVQWLLMHETWMASHAPAR